MNSNIKDYDLINYTEYEDLLDKILDFNRSRYLEIINCVNSDKINLLLRYGIVSLKGIDSTLSFNYLTSKIEPNDLVIYVNVRRDLKIHNITYFNIFDVKAFEKIIGKRTKGRLWIYDVDNILDECNFNKIYSYTLTQDTKQIIIL